MDRRTITLLGVLGVAVLVAACGPTDTAIGAKVKANLASDETVKAAPIDVGVDKKVVTLSGTVDTLAVKDRATTVARGTDGVASVVDHLTTKERDPGPGHGREMMEKGMMEGKDHIPDGKRE